MTNAPRSEVLSGATSPRQSGDGDGALPVDLGDGRNLRRKRNRDAVISALIELIQGGDLQPTVAKIADRAEVSHRSVFRYFDDLNDLARTAIETEFRRTWPLSVVPNVGEGSLATRIDDLVTASIRTLERTHLLGMVARSRAIELDEVDRGLLTIYELRFDQVERQFHPELRTMSPDRAAAIATAVTSTLGLDSYDVQRRMLGKSPEEIADVWRIVLTTLLDCE